MGPLRAGVIVTEDEITWRGGGHPRLYLGAIAFLLLTAAALATIPLSEGHVGAALAALGGPLLVAAAVAWYSRSTTVLNAHGIRGPLRGRFTWADMSHLAAPNRWSDRVVAIARDGIEWPLELAETYTEDVARISGLDTGEPVDFTPTLPEGSDGQAEEIRIPESPGTSAIRGFWSVYVVIQLVNTMVQHLSGNYSLALALVFGGLWLTLGVAVLLLHRFPIANRSGLKLGFRRVPWEEIAYVEKSGRWANAATVVLTDGRSRSTALPHAYERQLARFGGIPYGKPDEEMAEPIALRE